MKSLGLKTNKVYKFRLNQIVIVPISMFIWSAYSIFSSYNGIIHILWLIVSLTGLFWGYQRVQKETLFFDKTRNIVQAKASKLPLVFSLSIFFLRYYINASKALNLNADKLLSVQICEMLACLVSAILLGRIIGYFIRKQTEKHFDLSC